MINETTKKTLETLKTQAKKIRLIATDLDGTLLNKRHQLSEINRASLAACVKKGIVICTATGRARTSIPNYIVDIPGMKYLITANGARIYDSLTGDVICESFLSKEAIEYVRPFLTDKEVLCEFFWDGSAHVDEKLYKSVGELGIPISFNEYFIATRIPTPDFAAVVKENEHKIENVNFVFATESIKNRIGEFLRRREDLYELTTSLPFNFEIGGKGVSKATAVEYILTLEGISKEESIAFGDNTNDTAMLKYAAIGVAPSNGVPEVLSIADYITDDNDNDGFTKALQILGIID